MRIAHLALVLCAACGGSETGDPAGRPVGGGSAGGEGGSEGEVGDEGQARPDARGLALGATWGQLVQSARQLDDESRAESDVGCVLRGTGPYRFTADVAVAIRPLPEAPEDLDVRLVESTSARLFTRWGQINPGGDLAVVAFTGTPAPQGTTGAAIFVTDQGIYVRPAGHGPTEGPLPFDEGAGAARATVAGSPMTLIAAESSAALSAVRDLLEALPLEASPRIALGVTLAPDVRLPDPTTREDDGRGLCPDGLPRLAGDAGELAAQAIVGALGPLRDGATRCMASATGPGAAGSRIGLAMRIGPDGRLSEACMTADSASDPALRDCLLEAARATTFPTPDPAGAVDVLLPMELVPDASLAQALICP